MLQQYYEHEQGFAHPKYACTAGYMKGAVLIDLLVRLPPAFTLDCKGMPIDRSFHVVCHRHVIFDNLHSQNAQK